MKNKRSYSLAILAFFAVLSLSSCASDNDGYSTAEISDPFEGVNRGILEFNTVVDEAVLEPVARGYRYLVPQPGRKGVRNFLRNLSSPTLLMNELLQGDFEGAGNVMVRAVVNTLIGIGGVFDVAGAENIPYEPEDFGQTMAVWGVGHGPYIMAPILGPGSVRDYSGRALDAYVDPVRLWLFNTDNEEWYYARSLVTLIDTRESLLEVIDDLRANSIDYYATLRSVYVQNRAALVADQDPSLAGVADFSEY